MSNFADCLIVHHTRLNNQSVVAFDWTDNLFKVITLKGVKINKSGFTLNQSINPPINQSTDDTETVQDQQPVSELQVIQQVIQPVTQSTKALFIEEVIYWVDDGSIEALIDDTTATRQELRALLVQYSQLSSPMASLHVYEHLKRADCIVLRPRALCRRNKPIHEPQKADQNNQPPENQSAETQSIDTENQSSDTENLAIDPNDPTVATDVSTEPINQDESTDEPMRPDPLRASNADAEHLAAVSRVDMFVVWDVELVSSFKRSDLCRPSRVVLVVNSAMIDEMYGRMLFKEFHDAVYAYLNEIFMQENVARLPFDFDSTVPIAIASVELTRVITHQFRPLDGQYLAAASAPAAG